MTERESGQKLDFPPPRRVLTKVLVCLAAPTVVLALLGGPLATLLLYAVIVVDGIALGWLALSKFEMIDRRVIVARNNDSAYDGYHHYGGRVESLAMELNQAVRRSNYFSGSARRNIAKVLSEILPPPSSASPHAITASLQAASSDDRRRRTSSRSSLESDLAALLSFNEQPARRTAAGGSVAKTTKSSVTARLLGGRAGRRGRDLGYLSSLERVVSVLEQAREIRGSR